MARRNDHSREEIQKIAIQKGRELIQDGGLNNASARKIAKEIGYTVGTLYNVFQNYNDLILHINATTLDELFSYVSQRSQQHNAQMSAIEKAQDLSQAYIDFASENYLLWRALYEFSTGSTTPLPEWYETKISQIFTLVAYALDDIVQGDAEKLVHAKIIWASAHGICQLALSNKLSIVETLSAKTLTATLVENYLQGLLRPK